ncbi:MAG: 3-dehydroquinate synthase [Firmicutes bacterium]|nr:3-dehydroquinate synthase [Bacillota bacterium]
MIIPVELGEKSYNIYLERGVLHKAGSIFKLDRRVLIVSDDGVPEQYINALASQCGEAYIEIFPHGEQSKNLQTYQTLLARMVQEGFSRSDCVVAIGGGVTGDMAGFAAASYMRGIDFYNIPTTLLSQVDSSIGGKVAVDFMGCKNIIGAFYQPKAVLIDSDVLATLEPRHIANGYAEIIKIAASCDKELFEKLEQNDADAAIDEIIAGALKLKKNVVEQDVAETGLRRVLNFGHTLGHAIESATGFEELYHGECVALGMLLVTEGDVRDRIAALLQKYKLPTEHSYDKQAVLNALGMDKKKDGSDITIVKVDEIGSFRFEKLAVDDLKRIMEEVL